MIMEEDTSHTEGIDKIYDTEDPQLDINSCLPLSLQQFCLITIVSELDSYPIELLAKLPLHFRRLLLSKVPVLDLCRLDKTPVAEGIDVNEIWRVQKNHYHYELPHCTTDRTLATLFVKRWDIDSAIELGCLRSICDDHIDLDPGLAVAMKERSPKEGILLHLLLKLFIGISTRTVDMIKENGFDCNLNQWEVADGLTSVLSHDFLVKLPGMKKWKDLTEYQHYEGTKYKQYETKTLISFYQLWKKQATPLSSFSRYVNGVTCDYDKIVRLVPKRLLSIHEKTLLSPLDFFNYIVTECGLQPLNVDVCAHGLHQAVCNLEAYYIAGEDCRLFLKTLTKRVVILELRNVSSEQFELLQCVFEWLTRDRNASTLKSLALTASTSSTSLFDLEFLNPHLFTLPSSGPSSPPHYQGLNVLEIGTPMQPSCLPQLTALIEQQQSLSCLHVCLLDSCEDRADEHLRITADEDKLSDTLSLLFYRENFQYLSILFVCGAKYRHINDSTHAMIFPIAKVLNGFVCSPCAHNKTLCFKHNFGLLRRIQQLQPVTISRSSDLVPKCGVEHKMLMYNLSDHDFIIPNLLRLPVICLRELIFNFDEESKLLFTRLCLHPNLNMGHFLIKFAFNPFTNPQDVHEPLSSICQDFEKLFQMPTLREFTLTGEWLYFGEIKKALAIGLQQQSQVCSIQKICLHHELFSYSIFSHPLCNWYTESEFKQLWLAVFSLPQVDKLEVDLWTETSITRRFIDMVHIITDCWKELAFEKKLCKLTLSLDEQDLRFLDEEKLEHFTEITHKLKIRVRSRGKADEIRDYN